MIDKIFPRKLNRSKGCSASGQDGDVQMLVNISIDDFDGNSDGSPGSDSTGDAGVIKPVKGNSDLSQLE